MSNSYPDLPNTKFPDQVDDFPRMRDITASEVVLMEQYQAFIKAKDITSAQNLIEANPGLKVVLLNAFNVNNVGDAVKALERLFDSNINGFITEKQTEMNAYSDTKKTEVLTYTDTKTSEVTNLINLKSTELTASQTSAMSSIQSSKDSALISIEQKKDNIITYMDGTTAGAIRNDMGAMGDLTTTDKSSLVKAINEVNSKGVDLTPITDKIGTDILKTTSQTLSGAINENADKIAILNGSGLAKEKASKEDLDTTNTNVINLTTTVGSHTTQLLDITQSMTETNTMVKLYLYQNIGGAL